MHVAFLRGMNLGRRRIKNDELCGCFTDMGFDRVSAFLASGNVMFDGAGRGEAELQAAIESGLQARLEYAVPTFVRSAAAVGAFAAAQPFAAEVVAATAGKLQVAVLARAPDAETAAAIEACATADDHLKVDGRVLYWLPKVGISTSDLDLKTVERLAGMMTIRTHNTMRRLAKKLGVA